MRYLMLFVFILFCSCNSRQQNEKHIEDLTPQFQINIKPLDIESDINKAVLFHNDIVCVLKNGKINVFDSLYHHKADVERKLTDLVLNEYSQPFFYNDEMIINGSDGQLYILDSMYNHNQSAENKFKLKSISLLVRYDDTVYALSEREVYYLGNNYSLVNTTNLWPRRKYIQAHQLFEDSLYDVRACCMGEFGGNVFFISKKTGKVTLYSVMSCASEIIKTSAGYFIDESLEHMAGITKYSIILNPDKLSEPRPKKSDFADNRYLCCNCDTINSEIYWRYLFEKKKLEFLHSAYEYYLAVGFTTVFSFKYRNNLFSMQVGDSILRLVSHKNYKVTAIDTINFDQATSINPMLKVNTNSPKYLGLCKSGYWSRKTALIIAQGNKIDILEYKNGL